MQSVARLMNEVPFDARVVRKRKINAVTRIADVVSSNQIAVATPLMNAIPASVGDEGRVTIFDALPDAFLDRFVRRGESVLPSMRLSRMRAPDIFFR